MINMANSCWGFGQYSLGCRAAIFLCVDTGFSCDVCYHIVFLAFLGWIMYWEHP